MENWKIGAIVGGVSGVVAALLMDRGYSLLTVILLGIVIGLIIGSIGKLGRKSKKRR